MLIKFPEYANKSIELLCENGFEGFFVGGCVRDKLLGSESNDIDITTNALPEDIIRIFDKTIPTGIKHGTVTVIIDNNLIEITTYRKEAVYTDSRHPDDVVFVSDLYKDLSRRDFTINAIAYNKNTGIIDNFNGINDLNNKVINTVGDPISRFSEDALRILRCIRFASTLNFIISKNALDAVYKCSDKLRYVSGERVLQELRKTIGGKNLQYLNDFINAGCLRDFGVYKLNAKDDAVDSLTSSTLDCDIKTALYFSFCDINITLLKETLKPDNKLYSNIKFIKDNAVDIKNKYELKILLSKYGTDKVKLMINYLALLDKSYLTFNDLLEEIITKNEPYSISHLDISGTDLIDLGFSGDHIGQALNSALLLVINEPKKNKKQELLQYILKLYHK